MFFLLKFLPAVLGGYFYRPKQLMVWHPIYKRKDLSPEERRQRREDSLPDEWTEEIWQESLKFWGNKCVACGSRKSLQRDHLVPVAHKHCPGAVPSNLLPLCKRCNQAKSGTDFTVWYQEYFGNYPIGTIARIHEWQYYCLTRGWR